MELNLNKPEDLAKLEGWTIKGIQHGLAGSDPMLVFRLEHLAAGRPIKLIVSAAVNFGRSGNILLANTALTLRTEDIT